MSVIGTVAIVLGVLVVLSILGAIGAAILEVFSDAWKH